MFHFDASQHRQIHSKRIQDLLDIILIRQVMMVQEYQNIQQILITENWLQLLILFIKMFLGQKTHSSLTKTKTELYQQMLRQLINIIQCGSQQYDIILTTLSAGDKQLLEQMSLFNKCILKLKNQDEMTKKEKEKLSDKVIIEIFKIGLNKQSIYQMQNNFKTKYGKYFQNDFLRNQVIFLIIEIKNKSNIVDSILNKLKQQASSVLKNEQLPDLIQKLIHKIQYYERIIAQINQFPKTKTKVPTLFNNKNDELLSAKIKKQIQNIYLINNVLFNISQRLNPFKVKPNYQQPKELKDILILEINNPMNMLLQNGNSGTTPEKSQAITFQCIQSAKECQKCPIIQAKWEWMKVLLTMNRQKNNNIMTLECDKRLFYSDQKHDIQQLLSTLKENQNSIRKIPILIKKIEMIAFKDNSTYKTKSYRVETMVDELKQRLDTVLSVCEKISQLPIIEQQKQKYKSDNNLGCNNLSILDQFLIIKSNVKGFTQTWYYQLAFEMAKKLKIFQKADQMSYENMAKKRKRYLLKIQQVLTLLQRYQSNQGNSNQKTNSMNHQTKAGIHLTTMINNNEQKLITKPMQLTQKQYPFLQESKRKLQELLERIKRKCIKQLEQCQKPKCLEGKTPMLSFQTIQQMFQKIILMKNNKIQQYSIEKDRLYKSLEQLSQKKENMQKQHIQNMQLWKSNKQKQTIQLLKDWNLQKQENIKHKQKVQNLQTQKQRLLASLSRKEESLRNITNEFVNLNAQNDVLNQQAIKLKQKIGKQQASRGIQMQSFRGDQQKSQSLKEYDNKIDQLEKILRTRSFQLEEAARVIKQLIAKFQIQIELTKQNEKKIIQQRFNLKIQQTNDIYHKDHEETLKYYHLELKKKEQQQELNKQKDKETIMFLKIQTQSLYAKIQEKEALIKDQLQQRITGLQNNMSIQQQNKDLIDQKNLCQQRIKELSDQVIKLKQQLNKVTQQKSLKSISIQQMQKNLQEKAILLQNQQTIISQHLKQIKTLNLKNKKYQEDIQMLINDKSMLEMEKQIDIDKQTSFRIQCQQKFIKFQHQISLKQSKITQKQGQVQEKKLQIERLNTILNQRKIQFDSQHSKFSVLERQHDDMKEIHKKQCQKLQGQLKKQQKNTEKSVEDLQKRLLNITDQKDRLQINNFSIQDKYESQMKRIKEEILKLQNVNKELQVMASKGRLNQGQIMQKVKAQAMKEVCEVVLKEKRQLFSKNSHLFGKEYSVMDLNLMNLYYFDGLFQGESLQDKVEYKIRLCQHIRKLLKGTNILRTKLLYKCDLKNKTNIHEYIDGKSNLLLVVRTSGNVCIAGYYSGVYHDGKMVDPGLLISLNNNQSYILNTADNTGAKKKQTELNFKAMQYDKFYVIFGNAEMRIKNGEKKILSNFGVSSAFYNSRGKKRQDFLGIQDKQTEVQTYEFYEVELDQNEEKKEIRQVTERHKEQPRRQQEERRQQQQNINSTRK